MNFFYLPLTILGLILGFILDLSNAQAQLSYQFIVGTKYPNTAIEGIKPIQTTALSPQFNAQLTGFTELLPYFLPSPDQEEAGSCLFMSLTGLAEWWLARENPNLSRDPEGPLDLSERYLMNLSNQFSGSAPINEWKTDSIFLYNLVGGMALRNADYRFTKGWFKKNKNGQYIAAEPNEKNSHYNAAYNWIDERSQLKSPDSVQLPKFKRHILFADPDSNQWNTGVMPDNIVEKIKSALQKNKAPVQIIYNHFGYWHAALIGGFDDQADNANCKFVHNFLKHLKKEMETSTIAAATYKKTLAAYKKGGGCHPQGVFYVRDSIYADPKSPVYDYDPSTQGEEAPYSKRIILLEYDWVRYMANHAIQVLSK